uniref:Uncharacterized protein n=1 Tax=Amorphochlora amoebiformis TaxID=1561963 RepID=A0A7S0DGR9_9EUKA
MTKSFDISTIKDLNDILKKIRIIALKAKTLSYYEKKMIYIILFRYYLLLIKMMTNAKRKIMYLSKIKSLIIDNKDNKLKAVKKIKNLCRIIIKLILLKKEIKYWLNTL